jgi:ribonuclease HIII
VDLPKGAGPQVEQAAIALVKAHGLEVLDKTVKKHFKITGRVLKDV